MSATDEWRRELDERMAESHAVGEVLVLKTMHLVHGIREFFRCTDGMTLADVAAYVSGRYKHSIYEYIGRDTSQLVEEKPIEIDFYPGLPGAGETARTLDHETPVDSLPGRDIDGVYWWPRTRGQSSSFDMFRWVVDDSLPQRPLSPQLSWRSELESHAVRQRLCAAAIEATAARRLVSTRPSFVIRRRGLIFYEIDDYIPPPLSIISYSHSEMLSRAARLTISDDDLKKAGELFLKATRKGVVVGIDELAATLKLSGGRVYIFGGQSSADEEKPKTYLEMHSGEPEKPVMNWRHDSHPSVQKKGKRGRRS